MDLADQPTPGRYRHFKGGTYVVVGVARLTETGEALAVYHPLADPGSLWARPAAAFAEHVDRPGYRGPRFVRVECTGVAATWCSVHGACRGCDRDRRTAGLDAWAAPTCPLHGSASDHG